MPVFTPLVALISSLVGYQIPVVCQPLPQGTTIQAAISVSAPGYAPFSGQHSWGPTMADAGGVTGPLGYLPPGATVTITVDGVTATLPPVPTDTPDTDENPPPAGYAGWVVIPAFIAIDQGYCDAWTGNDLALRGRALLAAIHEAMHAKYAEGNEALTECRAMQLFPTVLQGLFPAITDPGTAPAGPGPAPVKQRHSSSAAIARWKRATTHWRDAHAKWQRAYSQWLALDDTWTTQVGEQAAMTAAAQAYDAFLPPEYHGATC
jgi:hypothetical protein